MDRYSPSEETIWPMTHPRFPDTKKSKPCGRTKFQIEKFKLEICIEQLKFSSGTAVLILGTSRSEAEDRGNDVTCHRRGQ
eukprot:768625-Hanusia_phi.AAC.6